MQVSLKNLPEGWLQLLRWGPCFCPALGGEASPSALRGGGVLSPRPLRKVLGLKLAVGIAEA
jgi:hypothetical protein